ncbi:hypothetical protein AX14_001110 [Amanita brunnescens Koide BX004]|nr:hypothetical protein AX14_001110 [Amanita brunnescens Koide BX004]
MPAWFDIYSFGFKTEEDEAGMLNSSRQINELISAEVDAGINPGRIVLGGFSQGGAVSLLTGLTSERKLCGIATLSAWLPLHKKFKSMMSQHANTIPIFWGHGDNDPLVNINLQRASVDRLTNVCGIPMASNGSVQGLRVEIYPGMGHTTCIRELEDLKSWLKSVL